VLAAGGILPTTATTDRSGVDTLTARSYRHPAAGDRVVVRLVPAALGAAEDLAAEFLGFTVDGEPHAVGTAASRSLGFPAWALVHDPANGRHALALVKDLERLARLARSRPGRAMEGYEELADRLQRAAPRLLPTFWEQAGRSFVEAENARSAAVCFGRARGAERVHGLAVDEDRVSDVHLEFALAGALPVKALTQYAQDLARRHSPEEAYRRYRTVAVSRVAGGLAPPAGLLAEVARLARAAKRKPDEEAQSVLADLLSLPAVARSRPGFWASAFEALVALCRRDPSVRSRLLALQPDPPGWRADITDEWLALLEATGASDLLTAPVSTQESAGAWLERFLARRSRIYGCGRSAALIALARRMVPRLLAEGGPVNPIGGYPWRADLDVLDVLAEGGVPLRLVGPGANQAPFDGQLALLEWVGDASPGRRDLAALARHDALRPLLERGVTAALRYPHTGSYEAIVGALAASAGTAAVLSSWLERAARRAPDLPLASLRDLLADLAPLRTPAGVAAAPDAARQLGGLPLAPALARTLRAGLLTELGWPAFEDAVARFGPQARLGLAPTWPYLIFYDGERALVLGPEGLVLDQAGLRPPAKARWLSLSYVDGQVLVAAGDYQTSWAYWSADVDAVFPLGEDDRPGDSFQTLTAITLVGGGVTSGHEPLRAGDRHLPRTAPVISDGHTFWRLDTVSDRSSRAWREYDAATGTDGRFSQPAFVAAAPGPVRADECWLLPLGDEVVGLRVWLEPDGRVGISDVDGRTVRVDPPCRPRAVLTFPGSDEPRAVSTGHWGASEEERSTYTVHEQGSGKPASRVNMQTSSAPLPPVFWWSLMVARDPAGSLALRSVTDEQAAELLGGAPVAAVLPQVTDERLVAAVAREVAHAAELAEQLAELAGHAEAVPEPDDPAARVSARALQGAVGGLGVNIRQSWWLEELVEVRRTMVAVARALTEEGEASQVELPLAFGSVWASLLGAEAALALRLLGPGLRDEERVALRALLGEFARSPLVGTGGRVRVLTLVTRTQPTRGTILRYGARAAVVLLSFSNSDGEHRCYAVEYSSPDAGGAVVPAGDWAIAEEHRPVGWADGGGLAALLARFDAGGPPAWRPDAAQRLAELTGLSPGEATMLLAGAPGLHTTTADFLPKPGRELLGLTVARARAARDTLAGLPRPGLVAALEAALPADVEELWRTGPDVQRLADACNDHFGHRGGVDAELLAEATPVLTSGGYYGPAARDVAPLIETLVRPSGTDLLSTAGLAEGLVEPFAVAITWLAYRVTVDDPIRAALPAALRRIRGGLADPRLTLSLGTQVADLGPFPALAGTPHPYLSGTWDYSLAPARLSGEDDPVLRLFGQVRTVRGIAWLLSERLTELVEWSPPEGLPAGAYPHDPRLVASSTVDAVVTALDLERDAAAYYLQLLALPDPTDRNVARWTGWSAKRVKELAAALVAAGVAVAAKRERSGRGCFLPGGWLALKAPSRPIEAWKAPLYGLATSGAPPLSVLLPLRPVASLFSDAWHRVQEGDGPRLEPMGR